MKYLINQPELDIIARVWYENIELSLNDVHTYICMSYNRRYDQ